jgi:hypothetical protein
LGAIESFAARFAAWARRVGENRVAYLVLAVSFLISAALILVWGPGQTFINDEWNYLVVYRGLDLETLLAPQNGHLVVLPRLLYRALFETFGVTSHVPYQVATIVLHLTVASIFFALVRRHLQLIVAVGLTLLVVFFGVTWDTLMGAYQLPNLTGMAAGLGMLLALERRTRGGDIAASILLAISLASFSVGIAFAFGGLVSIWLSGKTQWRRAWLVLVPGLLYVAWFIWARKFDQSTVSAEAVGAVLAGAADQLAAICAGITGLFRVPGSIGLPVVLEIRPEWGYPLALALAALVVLHLRRAPRSVYFWTVLGTLLVYLALVAFGLSPARTPESGRYVYMGGLLTLLLIAELARDIRWSTVTGVVACLLFGLTLMANVAQLRAGGHLFQAEGETNRATLAALELSGKHADLGISVEDEHAEHSHADMFFPAWAYFEVTEDFGSPAFSLDELRATGEQAKEAADQEFVRVLGITAEPTDAGALLGKGPRPKALAVAGGKARPLGHCLWLRPDPGRTGSFQLEVPPGGIVYRAPNTELAPKLARFGTAYATELPATRGSTEIAIPVDSAETPWRVQFDTPTRTLVCSL